jgi:hypothetical protein
MIFPFSRIILISGLSELFKEGVKLLNMLHFETECGLPNLRRMAELADKLKLVCFIYIAVFFFFFLESSLLSQEIQPNFVNGGHFLSCIAAGDRRNIFKVDNKVSSLCYQQRCDVNWFFLCVLGSNQESAHLWKNLNRMIECRKPLVSNAYMYVTGL